MYGEHDEAAVADALHGARPSRDEAQEGCSKWYLAQARVKRCYGLMLLGQLLRIEKVKATGFSPAALLLSVRVVMLSVSEVSL